MPIIITPSTMALGNNEEPPLPEPVVRFADLTVDADARPAQRTPHRARARAPVTRRKKRRSDTTRSWIDGTDEDESEDGEGRVGAVLGRSRGRMVRAER